VDEARHLKVGIQIERVHTDDKLYQKGACSGSRDPFLPRDTMLARYVLWLCVRPCVGVSDTSRWSKTTENIIVQTKPHEGHGLWFAGAKDLGEIAMDLSQRGAK